MKNKARGAIFLQSKNDFPCPVVLGNKKPSFGLHRFKQELKFTPIDDEGFILRGGKRQLLYKGQSRSHRFNILGDSAFEYDCILKKEPESNVISLLIDGAENYDFFRQPDFVKEPILKGSYAVYKKETLIGDGTGKLCHIHRPEIIDARGRRCWGDLSVVGDNLHITIPERWLGEAAYPVIVDPKFGNTTVGSQHEYWDDDSEDWRELFLEDCLGVMRLQVGDPYIGKATAHVYAYNTDWYGRCKPVFYGSYNSLPTTRFSNEEATFDIEVSNAKPAGWRTADINSNTFVQKNYFIFFGIFCDFFAPKFDYGQKCFIDFWGNSGNDIPATYPLQDANKYYDYKLSMYLSFTYTPNIIRTLTQGADISDKRKIVPNRRRVIYEVFDSFDTKEFSGNYKRNMTQETEVNDIKKLTGIYERKLLNEADIKDNRNIFVNYLRSIIHDTSLTDIGSSVINYIRNSKHTVMANSITKGFANFLRKCVMTVSNSDIIYGLQILLRKIIEKIPVSSSAYKNIITQLFRNVLDTITVSSSTKITNFQFFLRNVLEAITVSSSTKITKFQFFLRNVLDTIAISSSTFIKSVPALVRNVLDSITVSSSTFIKSAPVLFRNVIESITVTSIEYTVLFKFLFMKLIDNINVKMNMMRNSIFLRNFNDNVKVFYKESRIFNAIRKAVDFLTVTDKDIFHVIYIRTVPDNVNVKQGIRLWFGIIIKRIVEIVGSKAVTNNSGEYYRFQSDTVKPTGSALSKKLKIVKIFTELFIKDFILKKFLIAKLEVTFKSFIAGGLIPERKLFWQRTNMGKIYKSQSAFRLKLITFCELIDIKSAVIKYNKPDGRRGEWPAYVVDFDNGIISHECIEGEIDMSGWWSFWAFVTFDDGRTAVGEAAKVYVWREGS